MADDPPPKGYNVAKPKMTSNPANTKINHREIVAAGGSNLYSYPSIV